MPQEESTPVASLFDKDQLDDVLTKATLLDRFARSGQSPEEFAKENDISATTLRRRLAAAREGSRNLIDKRKGRSVSLSSTRRRSSRPFTNSWRKLPRPRAGSGSVTPRCAAW
jgi:hypothetical protein